MSWLRVQLTRSPIVARVFPFVLFVVLASSQELFGATGRYWIYLTRTVLGALMLWAVWPTVTEMRWKFSWEAVAIGVVVFVIWVGLDDFLIRMGMVKSYPKISLGSGVWNPKAHFGVGNFMATFFILVRLAGSTLVVPPLEEVFYRSFVYRYLIQVNFLSVPLGRFVPGPFLLTSALFAAEHREWLAGLLCGLAYQGLVCWKNRLGDAMTAHAITNFLLGLWVVARGDWTFW